jgi:drug/metabolite transporter (DMT)-like permease
MAGLLYLGAGLGMLITGYVGKKAVNAAKEASLNKSDLLWVILMIVLDVSAPILLLFGLSMTVSANASLLFNFEIVATTLVARLFFKESVNKRIGLAITLITLASVVLSFESGNTFRFSAGSLLVLGACICWGFENNCTRNISAKNPFQIVILKGIFSGGTSLVIGLLTEAVTFDVIKMLLTMLLGFFSYGLSVFFYVKAQRELGAARTSAYYAFAPFAGVLFSFAIFGLGANTQFIIAFVIMCIGAYLSLSERHSHTHTHEYLVHEHRHTHDDGHHSHHAGDQLFPAGTAEGSARCAPPLHHGLSGKRIPSQGRTMDRENFPAAQPGVTR